MRHLIRQETPDRRRPAHRQPAEHGEPDLVETLEQDLRPHLDEIEAASDVLVEVTAAGSSPLDRRQAHRRLRLAYEDPDRVLRDATRQARSRSYREWSRLRSQLSALDTARQQHLMEERDDVSVLPLGAVQALDTGMSGPDIGELQHGRSVETGTPAAYGLDPDDAITIPDRSRPVWVRHLLGRGPRTTPSQVASPETAPEGAPLPRQAGPERSAATTGALEPASTAARVSGSASATVTISSNR